MYSYVLWPNPEPKPELLLKQLKSCFPSVNCKVRPKTVVMFCGPSLTHSSVI